MNRCSTLAVGLVVGSCSTAGLVATTTTNPPEPDIVDGRDFVAGLQCTGLQESGMFEYAEGEPFPFANVDEAVRDLITHEERNRADWLQLQHKAVVLGSGEATVNLADDADVVRLVVWLERREGRWRVAGYESCAPDG